MNIKKVEHEITRLHLFCEGENYKGYSLFDSHNSTFPIEKLGKTPSFLINQVVKRSPINLRPLLRVKKGINPKGYGLFLHAYSMLYSMGIIDDEIILEKTKYFFEWLINNPSSGYSGHCWGYNYDWPRSDGSMFRTNTPSVVVSAFICRAFMEYYKISNDDRIPGIINSVSKFVLNDVYKTKHPEGTCFSYTPAQRDTVFNANLLAAEILAYDDELNKKNEHDEVIADVMKFTLHHQNEDGSWWYSLHPKTNEPKKQIDFHQGYMVETMERICKSKGWDTKEYNESIERGVKFYIENQFTKDGQSLWRIPKKWPVDIHNQSQGIITFSYFKHLNSEYLGFAEKIINWTFNNLQSKKGSYYYQKWPVVTSKINYLRWNQGWMFVALSTYLRNSKS